MVDLVYKVYVVRNAVVLYSISKVIRNDGQKSRRPIGVIYWKNNNVAKNYANNVD